MSDTPTTTSLVTLSQEFRHDVVRQINRKCATVRMIPKKRGEGKNIAWAPESDGALVENYTEGQDATNFGGDAQSSAFLTWALYRSAFHVTELAMDTAATSSSPDGNRQLWARQVVNNSAKLASLINQKIFTGTGSGTEMTGLTIAVDDNNTYAGIDRTQGANAYFRSYVADPGSPTAISFQLMRDDLRKVFEACGETPDCAVVSPAVFNEIGALFDATRRRVESISGPNGQVKLDAGFQALEVDGTVVYRDKDCTANAIFYLNMDHLWLEILPSASQDQLLRFGEFDVPPDDGFSQVPLDMKLEMLAKTGPSDKAEILWQGNLVCDRPNTCAVRYNVQAAA